METLGQRLKIVRQGLSQQAAADKLGIPQSTWSNYESGRNQPDFALLDKICSLFGIKIEWLIFGRGPVYDEDKVHLVHATVGGGPNALRCGQPLSTIELRPEYKQEIDRNAALEARVTELEKLLTNAKDAEIRAKDETLRAYKQAMEAVQALAEVKAETATLKEKVAGQEEIMKFQGQTVEHMRAFRIAVGGGGSEAKETSAESAPSRTGTSKQTSHLDEA